MLALVPPQPQRVPITDPNNWAAAFEIMTLSHVRSGFAFQQLWLRTIWGL